MLKKKPLISIITSSWNREKYLKILANSLKKQSYQNFEWLIGDDGSIDNTSKFIKLFSKKVKFKIVYISSDIRIGKSKMVNLLVERASGKYITECDSDDYYLPNSLRNLLDILNQKKTKNKELDGIIAQNINTKNLSETFKGAIPEKNELGKWETLQKKIDGDSTIITLAKNYKKKKFLEVDFLITESSLLNKIFKNKNFLLTPKIVKVMDRDADDSVSFGKKIQYCRGSVYCIAHDETQKKFEKKPKITKILIIVNYFRYSIHADINFNKALRMFKPLKTNYLYMLLFPISYIISLRDRFLKKVIKTHIEFEKNKKNSKISIHLLN